MSKRILFAAVALMVAAGIPGAHAADAPPVPGNSPEWPQFVEGGYQPVTPTRIVDTRTGLGGTTLGAGQTHVVDLVGAVVLPATGVTGVVFNVTVVNASEESFVRVWDTNRTMPGSSNVNAVPGVTAANQVLVGTADADDSVDEIGIFNHTGTVDVIVDLVGWLGSSYALPANGERSIQPWNPFRLVDTRTGLNTSADRIGPGETRVITHDPPLPSGMFNVTVVGATEPSYLTVWGGTGTRPATSNLNLIPGRTTANLVTLDMPTDAGTMSIYNAAGSVDVVVDLVGLTFPVLGESPEVPFPRQFSGLAPARLADTRTGPGAKPLGKGEVRRFPVAGIGGVPAAGVGSVSLNIAAVSRTAGTYLTAWSGDGPVPPTSNVNAGAGETVGNSVHAEVADDGTVSVFNFAGDTDVVIDVAGWYAPPPAPEPVGVLVVNDPYGVDLDFDRVGDVLSVSFTATVGQPLELHPNLGDETTLMSWRVLAPNGTIAAENSMSLTPTVSGTHTILLTTLTRSVGTNRIALMAATG